MTTPEATPAYFAGKFAVASDGALLPAVNPATGEKFGWFPDLSAADVDTAVRAADAAFREWRHVSPRERAGFLLKLADVVEADRERLLLLDVRDNGSPIREMASDIDVGLMYLRYFAGLALEGRGETIPTASDRLNFTIRQPYGVVARILPFNHPLMFALRSLPAPLVTGNTVILKPSEQTSMATLALGEHLARIFPPGVASVLTGSGARTGDALVTHPLIRRLAFIGSDVTGQRILERAAQSGIKTVTLELGGKNPIIIWPDADLDMAIEGVVSGMRFNFQSQACGSTSRVLIPRTRYQEVLKRLKQRLEAIRVGMPEDPATDMGAIVSSAQLSKVLRYIGIGHEEGARLVTGGSQISGGRYAKGHFVKPTLFSHVDPESRLAREEIFGPVLAAIEYEGYEEALRIANDTRYGLSASLYTNDLDVALRFARDIEAGYVWINENQRHFLGTPFGGWKDSGIGKEEDPTEMLSYTQVKNVHVRFRH